MLYLCAIARAQISPGPLSRAHQQLEGVSKCATCHDFGAGGRSFKCLDCHAEIRRRVETRAGFHARVFKPAPGQADCARCHMEHNGLNFALARLDRKGFDHAAQTGFTLEGKHRAQACEQCHNEKKLPAAARAEIKVKDPNRTFLGLRKECAACHDDRHRGQLGAECLRCHTQESWKPAPGFHHSRASFPLTGLHQAVACQKCHVPRAQENALLFKGIAFASCQNCHPDPHRGAFQDTKFRGSCENCHNTNGWKGNRPGSAFNHATTKFALAGKHGEAACGACHKSSDFHKPIAHEACRDCHQDPHRGQFAARAAGADCASCHVETGFKPAKFDREAHRRGKFPLEGKHAELPCAKCHQPEGKGAVYMTGKLACAECHEDRHRGEFAAAPIANRCDVCHTVAGFQTPTFDLARHAETKFALSGKHASVACAACHKGQPRQYHFAVQTCNGCHEDPHRTTVACETCHTTDAWKAVRAFDHSATKFKIEGGHEGAKCDQCHVRSPAAPRFAGTMTTCVSCHQRTDPHAAQFTAAPREEDCAACHTATQWKSPAFDHDRARFTLDVAHRNVACAKCHKERTMASKTVRTYRGTPLECVQCH